MPRSRSNRDVHTVGSASRGERIPRAFDVDDARVGEVLGEERAGLGTFVVGGVAGEGRDEGEEGEESGCVHGSCDGGRGNGK